MKSMTYTVWMNDDAPDGQLSKAHEHDAGMDIVADEDVTIGPGEMRGIRTGMRIALPPGTVGIVKGRSGLALKAKIEASNAGVIDQGYRGDVMVILRNCGDRPFEVRRGDRIAQLVILRLAVCEAVRVERLPESEDGRGENGFGSSGGCRI